MCHGLSSARNLTDARDHKQRRRLRRIVRYATGFVVEISDADLDNLMGDHVDRMACRGMRIARSTGMTRLMLVFLLACSSHSSAPATSDSPPADSPPAQPGKIACGAATCDAATQDCCIAGN